MVIELPFSSLQNTNNIMPPNYIKKLKNIIILSKINKSKNYYTNVLNYIFIIYKIIKANKKMSISNIQANEAKIFIENTLRPFPNNFYENV